MWKKIAIGGATAAVIVGAGTAALATSGTTSGGALGATNSDPGTSSTSSPSGSHSGKHGKLALGAKRFSHGQIVTKGGKKSGSAFVTHDLIRGTVTSVSPTSIVVKAADNTSETFTVNSATKVVTRTAGQGKSKGTPKTKPSPSKISDVAKGDDVLVAGTGSKTFTATRVVDLKK